MSKKTEEQTKEQARAVASKHPLETILIVALCVPVSGDPSTPEAVSGLPVLFLGPPGIGKSQRAKTASARLGLDCYVIFPSCLQPEDVSGVLVPDGNGGANKISMLDAVRKLHTTGRGVLFIDELTGARPATQGALLGAVLDRQFGDIKLPGAVRIIAAANPPEEAAGGWELEPPMANRFAHFAIAMPRADEWVNYLLSQNLPRDSSVKDYEELLKQNWDAAWARSQGLYAGFHTKTNGRFLHVMPPEGSNQRGGAWPSPRTWENAARSSATCMALSSVIDNSDDLMLDFVTACVGPGAAGEFGTWLREANLPNPEDVLRNGWVPDKLRIDRNYAVFTAMTAFVLGTKDEGKRMDYAVKAFGVLEMASDAGLKDLVAAPLVALVNKGLTSSLLHSTDPAKKKVGEAAVRLMTKIGKAKMGGMLKDFRAEAT